MRCFNGAATFRSRNDRVGARQHRRSHRFNGAATFRSRNAHGRRLDVRLAHLASMGPRPFGRGMAVRRRLTARRQAASMGPRPFGRGMIWNPDAASSDEIASMGPRPFGRGMFKVQAVNKSALWASMGPRPFGRGMRQPFRLRVSSIRLQWGRDLSVAECARHVAFGQHRGRFNGAATFRSRNADALGAAIWPQGPASMGPRPFGRGMSISFLLRREIVCCFNGAATFRSRNVWPRRPLRTRCMALQWGRDLSVAECIHAVWPHGLRACFNGAATFRSRNVWQRLPRLSG